jgi:hypothetical protein
MRARFEAGAALRSACRLGTPLPPPPPPLLPRAPEPASHADIVLGRQRSCTDTRQRLNKTRGCDRVAGKLAMASPRDSSHTELKSYSSTTSKYKYNYAFKISIQFWSRRDSVVPLA